MPRVIFRMPYLKGVTGEAHRSHLVNYIATRERVEKVSGKVEKASKKQENFILEIIKEYPNCKDLLEYGEYLSKPNIENADEFITTALEQNLDQIQKRENFVDYIANRPRAEKLYGHGLFTSGNDRIVLSKVAGKIAHHRGNIWIPIISLTREDAARTGFDNALRWKDFLSKYSIEMAQCMGIPLENFHWYAAFHNERHHPHVHMIIYSDNPKQGFLTQEGIAKIKSGLVKNIFADEMNLIYAQQSQRRDYLKNEGKKVLQKLLTDMQNADTENPKMELLFAELSKRLQDTTGRHVYAYLPSAAKTIVDEILDELSKIPQVAEAYELWYEMRNEVLQSYFDDSSERLPLSQQQEFKSLKNLIIKETEGLVHVAQAPKQCSEKDAAPISHEMPIIENPANSDPLKDAHLPVLITSPAIPSSAIPSPTIAATVGRLLHHMSRIFADNLTPLNSPTKFRADSKLLRKIREKKIALGHKEDDHHLEF